MLRTASVILILLLSVSSTYAQLSEVQRSLSKALEFYREGNFDQSWEILTDIDTPQAELLKVKILTKQASFQQAYTRVLPLTRHPLPALREDALYTLAVIQFYRKEISQTLNITFELKKYSKSAILRRDAANFFYETVHWLTVQQSNEIIQNSELQEFTFELFRYHLGKLDYTDALRFVQANKRRFDKNFASALSEIDRYLASETQFKRYTDELRSDTFGHYYYTIGIVLPEHPKRHELYNVSRSLYGGIQVWIDQYNAKNKNIHYRLSYFRLNPQLENLNELPDWAQSENIDAIIGPISSHAAKEVSKALEKQFIPILAPLANDPQLTDNRPTLFQLNPGVEQRAKAYANFSMYKVDVKNIAIITDQDPLSRLEADLFKKEFVNLGGSISHDFGDLSQQNDSELRNILQVVSQQGGSIPGESKIVEALLFLSTNSDAKRLFDRTISALDAVGSRVILLGTQNLNYITIPSRVRRDYQVYTYSPYDENPLGKSLSDLKVTYKNYIEFEPDIYTFIGYDSAALISSLTELARNQTQWVEKLHDVRSFRGLAVPGSFDENRVNRDVYFYRLTSSGKERIDFSVDK
jgi:ABC-type branched-subunit amino acid transport system substrate-binding protein/predicted nucleic acid-binding protein